MSHAQIDQIGKAGFVTVSMWLRLRESQIPMHNRHSNDGLVCSNRNASVELAIDVITDGFALFDANRKLVICNKAYKNMRPDIAKLLIPGVPFEDLLQISLRDRHPHASKSELRKRIKDMCIIFEKESHEFTIEIATGQWIRMNSYRTADGGTVLLRTDISELVKAQQQLKIDTEKLKELAYHDVLTGLPNRKKCIEAVTFAIDIAQRRIEQFSIFAIDLNKFKSINDTLGHHAGDEALCQFSERVSAITRKSDILARMGGDEFTLFCPTCPSQQSAEAVVKKICDITRRPFLIEGQNCEMGCSIGVAIYPRDGLSCDTLLRDADDAMYKAKKSGQPYVFFGPRSLVPL